MCITWKMHRLKISLRRFHLCRKDNLHLRHRVAVAAGAPSDPYLMLGYERKELALSHAGAQPVTFTVEVDFAADNTWSEYARFTVPPGQVATHVFPAGYNAHWVRLKSDTATRVTATFAYGAAAP